MPALQSLTLEWLPGELQALLDRLDWPSETERLAAVLFDAQMRPFRTLWIAEGAGPRVSLCARRLLSVALACDVHGLALAHNHPSADPRPSLADRRLTGELKRLLGAVEIALVDHLILAGGSWSSMRDAGLL